MKDVKTILELGPRFRDAGQAIVEDSAESNFI